MPPTRRKHNPESQAKVALGAVRSERTVADLAQQYEIYSSQIADWKRLLLERAADVFGTAPAPNAPAGNLKELHAKIGRAPWVQDFLHSGLSKAVLLSCNR